MKKRQNQDQESNKESGDTWVSYSDLFTSLSIIFLTMFVFALLQAGLNKIEKKQTKVESQKREEGKITEAAQKEMDRKKEILENTVHDLEAHKNIINKKVLELNDLSKKIQNHKDVVKNLIEEQSHNEVVIKDLWTKIEEKETQRIELQNEVIKKTEETKIINQKNDQMAQTINKLKKETTEKLVIINNQKIELKDSQDKIEEKKKNILELEKNMEDLSSQFNNSENNKKILENNLNELKENYNQLKIQESTLVSNLESKNLEMNKLMDEMVKLNKGIEQSSREVANKDKIIQNIEEKLSNIDHLNKELNKNLEEKVKKIQSNDYVIKKLDKELENKAKNIESISNDLVSAKRLINKKEEELKSKIEKNNQQLVEINSLMTKLEGKNSDLYSKEKNIEMLSKELSMAKDRLNKSNIEIERNVSVNNQQLAEINNLIDKIKEKDNKLTEESKNIDSLNKKISSIQEEVRLRNLDIKVEKLKNQGNSSKINSMLAKLETLNKEKIKNEEDFRKEKELLTANANFIKVENDQLKFSLKNSDLTIKDLNNAIADFQKDRLENIQHLKELEKKDSDYKATLAQLMNEMSSKNKNIAKMISDNQSLKDQIKQSENLLAGLNNEKSTLEEKLKTIEYEMGNLNKINQDLIDKNKRLADASNVINLENENLKNEKGKLLKEQDRIHKGKNQLASDNQKLLLESKNLSKQLADLNKRNNDLKDERGSVNGHLDNLKNKILALENSLGDLKNQNNELKNLNKEYEGKNNFLAQQGMANKKAYKDELEGLIRENLKLKGDNFDLASINNKLKGNLASQSELAKDGKVAFQNLENLKSRVSDCQKEQEKLKNDTKTYKSFKAQCDKQLAQLFSINKELQNKLAKGDINVEELKSRVKRKIAGEIESKLSNLKLKVKTNPKTGDVTILMDDSFLFEHGSSELSNSVKKKLKDLIPTYAEALFSDTALAKAIDKVLVVGHASPVFNLNYVNPNLKNTKAYRYNLLLSKSRAKNISFFLKGTEIGLFEHKDILKAKLYFQGMGYKKPVLSTKNISLLESTYGEDYEGVYISKRQPSSVKLISTKSCGFYDCKNSRRVEIKFDIKNDKASLIKAYFK